MILGTRVTELLFEVGQYAVLPIHVFDFEFSKALKHGSVFHNRYVIERDICDSDIVRVHPDTRPPDPQGCHRFEPPLSEVEKE